MKKILSLILALAMALTLAVPAFAETTGTISSSTSGTASGSSNIGGSVNNTTAAYVMVIPAGNNAMNMKSTDAQGIGSLTVKLNSSDASKTFDTEKKVSVSIASTNKGKLKNATETITSNNTLDYTLGMTEVTNTTVSDTSVTTSEWPDSTSSTASNPTVDFAAEGITSTGTSVAMTATITGNSTTVANGTYKDTLTFNASVKLLPVTLTNAGGKLLSSDNLGTPSDEFTVSSGSVMGTFVAYNSFISTSSKSNWQNAQDFVAKLNAANYDGHNDWCLLGSSDMATAWKSNFGSVNRGDVLYLWSSVERSSLNVAYVLHCVNGGWYTDGKSSSYDYYGFVVLRPVAN